MNFKELRTKEFARLVDQQHVYVDYTGGGQCPASVMQQYSDLLQTTAFGNPHSYNPTSLHTTELIEEVRGMILDFYNAKDDYTLIFTQNASGALKILGESYPWGENSLYIIARDNHNSVLGIREYAKKAGATVQYWELDDELRLQNNLGELIGQHPGKDVVVAYPAQSNFSGVMHSLEYVERAHQLGATVFLDTAAFVPTHTLDLQAIQPDAACVSFYKVLGFPTGIGALLIRNDLLEKLEKAWFAGGTVRGVSLEDHVLERGHESFEDGTVNYALIPGLKYVYEFIEELGGVEKIEEHVTALTAKALEELQQIENVVVYGPKTMDNHGATVAFNILDKAGAPIHYGEIEKLAYDKKISLRGGCFCNPGAGSKSFGLDSASMQGLLGKLKTHSKEDAAVPGAIRVSFGIANSEEDVNAVIDFVKSVVQ